MSFARKNVFWAGVFFLSALSFTLFFSCSADSSDDVEKDEHKSEVAKPDDSPQNESGDTKVTGRIAGSYFWGTWIRMDSGDEYEISETAVSCGGESFPILSATSSSVSSSLGTFTRQSDSVFLADSIPYFRKGGTNLSYTMKLVGFSDSLARAASSTAGCKVTGKSNGYGSFESTASSESDGTVTLKAPVSGDTQIVTVSSGDATLVVVPAITVETNGSNMGTIAIPEPGQYSLKVTGTISDEEKDDGYLFGNNYKTYKMEITVTNISDVDCNAVWYEITPADDSLVLEVASDEKVVSDLAGFMGSSIKAGLTKTIKINVTCKNILEPFIDSGINVSITNQKTKQKWVDFIPLRFFRGLVPITVATKSVEGNSAAFLNGFVVYPDGNSQFFSIPDGGDKTLYVPSFGASENYMLSFCGATANADGDLSTETSSEMYYSVNPGSEEKYAITIPKTASEAQTIYSFGEQNDTEDSSYKADEKFIAYLEAGDIDYFSVSADSDTVILPSGEQMYKVYFETAKGIAPETITVKEGESLKGKLPSLLDTKGYCFAGWYMGNYSVSETYSPKSNITLTAEWNPIRYSISYELNGGIAGENPTMYTVESDVITLSNPTCTGYEFKGWYESEDFSGSAVTAIAAGSTGDRKFYAKWEIETYNIAYNLNGGTLSEENPVSYTIETATITLKNPTRTGYTFGGWYESAVFKGRAVSEITKGNTGNRTLYANWNAITYTIRYELNDGTNASENPTSYTVESETITLSEPCRTGYEFKGWYESSDFSGSAVTAIAAGSTGDRKFYAKWEIETYSIAYNLNGGTLSEENPVSYTIETATFTLKNPTRTGYTFGGWYESAVFKGRAVSEITKGNTGNRTLYANWNAITYTIRYELNDGTNASGNPASYTIEDSLTLSNPTRAGATFAGWYESSDFSGSAVTGISAGSIGTKTFYAKWNLIAYSITYNLNGGTNASANPATYTVEDSVSLANPSRSGQVFLGWYENAVFTGEKITGIALGSTGSKTFYAKWDAQSSITVTESALSDISVEKSQSGNIVIFTADAGFSSYKWEVDGTAQSTTSRICTIDTTGWVKGSYEVTLEAKSGGRMRSAIFYIQVEAN